ncbi:MAG: hypothetical protein COU08_02375 [Candidatus Harrisonbacteria bacterium CG10_big_fil_rev_8_21_14_0_10_42_17]|uniref:Uncharacterized protein n=1 Tax=Candidatus Harrisonbacteria bacterium CG10_big_fil_rev_8_21_14_0_10_42_17 TaxID=1974584 RepID=A0A2M6WI58_9BACT|nr:MAG: hypothetical protein COU08_02375 [Candidatus Harrisonbacteria bacterium CG10_big_fil_rev_8_21_14_0_10_42_17]
MPSVARAHCPLCTAGAGALAVLAISLGISPVVVGLMIGSFALALGLWLARLPKKNYIPYQQTILTIIIFLGTIIPIMPFIRAYGPLYIALFGDYGTLFHNTYTINLFLVGSLLGALLVASAPMLSKKITKLQGTTLPFQGLMITFALLVTAALIIELGLWR